MRLEKTLIGLLGAASAASVPPLRRSENGVACAQEEVSDLQKLALERKLSRSRLTARADTGPPSVNVYQHVLAYNKTLEGGYLAKDTMDAQFKLMQDSFKPYNITLNLAETIWYANASLAYVNRDGGFENEVRAALHKGTFADLNMFYVANLTSGVGNSATGWCTWPWGPSNKTYDPNETSPPVPDARYDGCFVNTLTTPILHGERVPDWFFEAYSDGKIAVHEAGHWFGLFHVFEGGCSGPGDYVNDTAPQGSDTFTIDGVCDNVRPGCFLGTDPPNYKNHMDYSDDKCRIEFTNRQKERMHSIWNLYRAPYKTS